MRMAVAKVVLEARRKNERVKCCDVIAHQMDGNGDFSVMKIDEYGLRIGFLSPYFYFCDGKLTNVCGNPIALRFWMKFKGGYGTI